MSVVTITFLASEEEITSGVPKYVDIESNVPSTIYFTIDGSAPTVDSAIYSDTISIATAETSVILSAFGISYDGYLSPTLTQTFAADTSRISVARNTGAEGIVLDRPDLGSDYEDGFDADGDLVRVIDWELKDLDIIKTDRGYLGISEGTAVEVGIPEASDTPSLLDDNFVPYSTPEIGESFNPLALFILIDNRKDNDLDITLRPFGSLHNYYEEFGGKRLLEPADDATYISGGFVRRFYDNKTNTMVSYYFDHNEYRYVKNIQELPSNIANTGYIGMVGAPPLIFKWIYRGRQSSI